MKYYRKLCKSSAIFLPVLFCFSVVDAAYGGAWTQSLGKALFIQNFAYYSTSEFFDNSGKRSTLNNYNKYEINPYLEYGLRDDITLGANLFLQRASQNGSVNIGIGDSEFFIRKKFFEQKGFVLSAEPLIKLPSLANRSVEPQIGGKNSDVALTISAGYGFRAFELNHFVNLDSSYRKRFGSPSDQLRFSFSAGVAVSENTMFLAQLFTTNRLAGNHSGNFTFSSGDDYDLKKLQISAVYKIDEKLSLQVGAFGNLAGKNTGGGSGTIFSVQKSF